MKRVQTSVFVLAAAAALWLGACEQGRGEPCQVNSDCSQNLLCCPAQETPRGVCIQASSCPEATPIDAGAPAAPDAASDMP